MAHPICFSSQLHIPSPSPSFIPPPSSKLHNPTLSFPIKPKRFSLHFSKPNSSLSPSKRFYPRAANQDTESNRRPPENQSQPTKSDAEVAADGGGKDDKDVSRLASKIREAIETKEPDFWSGVVEEIREIEWPTFNKVMGTTGVVLGVIAGSSIVLLTVNAILAELSDRAFAGMGVQDFFS